MKSKSTAIKYAFKQSVPVMAGYVVLGVGFGIILAAKGYGFIWAFVMSLTIYAGSMQYVAVDLLSGGASLITTAVMTLMVNARHLFYGISMLNKYKNLGRFKPYCVFALTDETFSLVCGDNIPENVDNKLYYFALSLMNQCYWIIGCTLGGIIGAYLPFNSAGVEFSMTALFVVVFIDQWRSAKSHISAVIGLVSSLVCLALFGADRFIIPSMIMITVVLCIAQRWIDNEPDEPENPQNEPLTSDSEEAAK